MNHRGLILLIVSLPLLIVQGCCTYRSADKDLSPAQLLGHRCVLVKAARFPESGSHWFPTFDPPTAFHPPLLALDEGTILHVAHIEAWDGPIDPSGTIVFADVENGPSSGHRVELGVVMWQPPHVLSFGEAGRSIRPFATNDEGTFYAADSFNSSKEALLPLRGDASPMNTGKP